MSQLPPYVADLDALDVESSPLRTGGNATVRQIAQAAVALIAEAKNGRGEVTRATIPTLLFQVSDATCGTIVTACNTVLAGNFNDAQKSVALCVKDLVQQVLARRADLVLG